MKTNHLKRLRLTLLGLVLAGSGSIASAQLATTNILYTFDTEIPLISKWYGAIQVAWSWNATNDAASNALSGSLQLDEPWFAGDQYAINFNWDNTGGQGGGATPTVDMSQYAGVDLDILVDPTSTLSPNTNYGQLQIIVNINYAQVQLGTYTIPASAVSNWTHVHFNIPTGLGNAFGPAFIKQSYNAGNTPAGPVTVYIDNLLYTSVPAAPAIATQPVDAEIFSGRNVSMNVTAVGAKPFSYQWYKGAAALTDGPTGSGSGILGSTNNSFSITNVSLADIAGYSVVVTNSAGSITSRVANVKIVSAAGAGTYANAVIASAPVAFYEMNETNDPTTLPAAFDHIGGFAGVYRSTVSNAFNGVQGPRFKGFTADNAAASFPAGVSARIGLPALNLNTNTVTITAWINPRSKPGDAGIVFCRSGSTTAGLDWAGGSGLLGYTWNNAQATWSWQGSGANPPLNEWSFVALVVTPDDATIYCMNASQGLGVPGVNTVAHPNQAFGGETRIGNDSNNSTTRTFDGAIDAVAIYNRSLSAAELKTLYYAGSGGPSVRIQGLDLSWDEGTLLEATNVAGPWTTNSVATSPYTITPTLPQQYFRLQIP